MAQTQCRTIFTSAGTTDLQLDAKEWLLVCLELETAGPVYIGTQPELNPIGSGKGIELGDKPRYLLLGPTDRLYSLSGALNRVSLTAHSLPNLVQIIMKLDEVIGTLARKFGIK